MSREPSYNKLFIPQSSTGELPTSMSFQTEKSLKLSHEHLNNECQMFSLTFTPNQATQSREKISDYH